MVAMLPGKFPTIRKSLRKSVAGQRPPGENLECILVSIKYRRQSGSFQDRISSFQLNVIPYNLGKHYNMIKQVIIPRKNRIPKHMATLFGRSKENPEILAQSGSLPENMD